ncbi:class I SAM-dependent methyltransferase [Nonomuraea soli]|uniref:SAM-dependent methyltransferase n=1 Tax=Nonomuraea soli TaxID=1032476 RepID=A0A7W0HS65_9ACTN|nr:class I SAM-dependent methyltransferase [Nonomuraea soli]MBA2893695.1 SAM-dependent methyltransferase [Nonomuraea soli]
MLDYDREAARYDATRGGLPRAVVAADAVRSLVAPGAVLLDVACGTGLVRGELVRHGLRVFGVDASPGMAGVARGRIPVAVGEAARLPLPDASVDAVSVIWLLHLLNDARPVIAECARVLRPGGMFLTTVDKARCFDDDLEPLLAPFREPTATDDAALVTAEAARHGLVSSGEARFVGHGQARSPAGLAASLRKGGWRFSPPASLYSAIADLPGQDVPRTDPVYRILAFALRG